MSKRTATTVTIQVRFTLPVGANAAMALAWIRTALHEKKAAGQSDDQAPMKGIDPMGLVVKLTRKETIYL